MSSDGRLSGLDATAGIDPYPPQRRVAELLKEVFGVDRSIAGRGEARRIGRRLLDLWSQELEPVSEDRLVAQLMEAAPFLWKDDFAEARAALAAAVGGEVHVAGPGGFRRRLLAGCVDLEAAQSLLASPRAKQFWAGPGARPDPISLARNRRWRRALAVWSDDPPASPEARLEMARALYAVGRFDAAKKRLHGMRREPARVLRLACQLRLGELNAVKRGLASWDREPPSGEALTDLAAIAVRLYANLGESGRADVWIERACDNPDRSARSRGRLLAAEAAWDRGDAPAMAAALDAVGEVGDDLDLAWRTAHVRGLLAMANGDGEGMVDCLGEALAQRRRQRPFEAAALWNDLAVGRAMTGDLAGAERALQHVVRLTGDGAGDRRITLALCNLAEIRLRRGKIQGVSEVIERSRRANEQAGNWRGWSHDQALWARYELVRGRPGAALATVVAALDRLAERECSWGVGALQLLAARAHGWMGEAGLARAALEETATEDRRELEPEELPAVWALAGDLERALEANRAGPCATLWNALLTGEEEPDWSSLEALDPYRAARLVFDAEMLRPDRVPGRWRRRAAAAMRAVGARSVAERLGGDGDGPWPAVERYLDSPDPWPIRLSELTGEISPDSRISWRDEDREVELAAGAGGRAVLERAFHGGSLRLAAPRVGVAERVLLALAARDLLPELVTSASTDPRRGHSMIGTSMELAAALDRLGKLAIKELPILIEGETGTGKELAARWVHRESPRSSRRCLPVNCAALSETLLLSELFGHVRGAFTGADRDRMGIFEAAAGGTVFLDEIGDLPMTAQGKLLRVLQEGEVRRVGESVARPVDVRVVAATHRQLETMVEAGSFRQDLYYRLRVGTVTLPPLRDRGGDVFMLAEHFLADEDLGLTPRLSEGARRALAAHSWPGNVRELKNVLAVASALRDGDAIRQEHLDLPSAAARPQGGYHEQVEALRRRLVRDALEETAGNRAEAARVLGLSRQALSYLVGQLDID